MSDEKREELEPQSTTEPTNEAKVSEELTDEELTDVSGGRKAGKPQQEFLVIKMNDVIITSVQ